MQGVDARQVMSSAVVGFPHVDRGSSVLCINFAARWKRLGARRMTLRNDDICGCFQMILFHALAV
jgi:hypothetical protein